MKHCVCGRPSANQDSGGICEHCKSIPIAEYVRESIERLARVPKLTCPQCGRAEYTRLTIKGICIDCELLNSKEKKILKFLQEPGPVTAAEAASVTEQKKWWD